MAFLRRGSRPSSGTPFRGTNLVGNLEVSRGVVTVGLVLGLAGTIAALVIPVQLFGEARRNDQLSSQVTAMNGQTTPVGFVDDGEGVQIKDSGPLTAVDRDFVRRVMLAGLWEVPAGTKAKSAGTTDAVKTAGEHMVAGHQALNLSVQTTAQILGIDKMPKEANPDQKNWLAQIMSAPPEKFDRTFVQLARSAHGMIFDVLAFTRTGTKNSRIRALADQADEIVRDHMKVLENTGLWNS
ncbi:DUF4142 domain-containing protein [Kitasatospora sp. NPDC059827]|uniref:DUF4142 domain-containing protein n=1 Tax=Kitasatospora sp. NPDC059827 TaxID=3346964 RepID=UPI0036471CE1